MKRANTSDIDAPFLDLHLCNSNGFVSSKIYYRNDKRNDFQLMLILKMFLFSKAMFNVAPLMEFIFLNL